MRKLNQQGFTIIELLIVIIVIGILAAIGFVAYGNVTKSARDSDRQADASALAKKAEEFYTAAPVSQYPDLADLVAMDGIDDKTLNSPSAIAVGDGCTPSATNDQYCYTTDGDSFTLTYWGEKDGALKTITGVNN